MNKKKLNEAVNKGVFMEDIDDDFKSETNQINSKCTQEEMNNWINKEIMGCFNFFWNESNSELGTTGYGTVLDSTRRNDMASIAGVGFALPAYVIGVERGFITREQGYERVLNTLKTIRDNIDHKNGFYVHFVDIKTGQRYNKSEYSTIDTAIMLMGAIVVGEYFGEEIKEISDELLQRTKWEWLVAERKGKPSFRMAYNPDKDGAYMNGNNDGWVPNAWWDHYAEQLMMYILYAGQDDCDEELARQLYLGFERPVGSFKSDNYVHCTGNPLFIHQFTHAFFDFRQYNDMKGFDWFQNSVTATIANRETSKYLGHNENTWGLTAMHSQKGYYVVGGFPRSYKYNYLDGDDIDGTFAPYGPLSSMPFTPELSKQALQYIHNEMPFMFGKYGIYDSYNLTGDKPWCSESYLAIDKGPTILMLDNYLYGTTWKYFMQSEFVKKSINVLKFQEK